MVDHDMSNSAQPRTAHVPPHRTDDDVLGLAEELSQLGKVGDLVVEYLERHLGLSHRDLHVLARLAEAPAADDRPRSAGAAADDDHRSTGTGTPGDLEQGVPANLEQRGLVTRGDDGQGFVVTEHGLVILDQVYAMRIRIADHLVNALGPDRTQSLRSLLQQMVEAIPSPVRSVG
ncbi:hypothetical protein [Pseudactinotalea sp. Z1748]|uniref:hypothetical protein n=1 Tax=Pseudactinotalea sp. Z1748 TaxID=3413027 RepID=UPI003C7A5591